MVWNQFYPRSGNTHNSSPAEGRFTVVRRKPSIPTRLESRGGVSRRSRYAENQTTPSIFAPNWDHPAGFSIASDLNTSKDAPKKCGTPLRSKLWSVNERRQIKD